MLQSIFCGSCCRNVSTILTSEAAQVFEAGRGPSFGDAKILHGAGLPTVGTNVGSWVQMGEADAANGRAASERGGRGDRNGIIFFWLCVYVSPFCRSVGTWSRDPEACVSTCVSSQRDLWRREGGSNRNPESGRLAPLASLFWSFTSRPTFPFQARATSTAPREALPAFMRIGHPDHTGVAYTVGA